MELLCLGANIAARSLDVVTTQHSLQAGAVEGVLHEAEMWIDPEHIRPDGVEAGPCSKRPDLSRSRLPARDRKPGIRKVKDESEGRPKASDIGGKLQQHTEPHAYFAQPPFGLPPLETTSLRNRGIVFLNSSLQEVAVNY